MLSSGMLKRTLDIPLAFTGLLLLSPLLLLVGILIKLDSRGPIFYRSVRVGWHGKQFRMFKFRTMVTDADSTGVTSTAAGDPRITRIGRYVRRLNLDELIQFINVLMGQMSIVGPRPQVPWAVEQYSEEERQILTVRPGITDWATLWIQDEGELLRDSQDPDKDYMEKIWPVKRDLQLKYVRERSTWTDIKIMLLTFRVHLINRILRCPRSEQFAKELIDGPSSSGYSS